VALADPFANLPPISFCNTDIQALQAAVISGFQAAWLADTRETLTLTLADRRTNFLLSLVAYLVQERQLIDASGEQNLLPFSGEGFIDNLGALFGPLASRLPATAAVTTLSFTLTASSPSSTTIPAGTEVQSSSTPISSRRRPIAGGAVIHKLAVTALFRRTSSPARLRRPVR
jgi:hypothetical protein